MFYAFGPRESLATLIALAAPFMPPETPDAAKLRAGCLAYLSRLQPDIPRAGEPLPAIVTDRGRIGELAAIFGLEDTPPGKRSGFEALRDPDDPMPAWKQGLLEDGHDLLAEASPAMGSLVDIVIDSIFSTANSLAAGSMTTGRAVGIVWVDPLRGWSPYDVAEAYAHELTHTLLTLDEHRFGHFPDYPRLRAPENLARSAIRSEERPLNAVVHSYVVAEELLQLRRRHGSAELAPRLHADTPTLHAKALEARRSIYDCANLEQLTSGRLREILARTDASFDALPPPAESPSRGIRS
jgi:hypothetical protein